MFSCARILGLLLLLPLLAPSAAQSRRQGVNDIVKRGEYLARAGDCIACHTAPEGRTFAGGRAMPTPFGTLYCPTSRPTTRPASASGPRTISTRDAHGPLSRRRAALSGDAVRVLHQGHARRLRRDLRLPACRSRR